jgi:hypothetical protein
VSGCRISTLAFDTRLQESAVPLSFDEPEIPIRIGQRNVCVALQVRLLHPQRAQLIRDAVGPTQVIERGGGMFAVLDPI